MIACDVVVAGGGSAGLAAAVAAARCGARTLLLERQGQLGGMASNALVHTICGLYRIREQPEPEFANEGFPAEFANALLAAGGASKPVRMGRVDVLPQDPVRFAALADRFAMETAGLETWLHAEIVGVTRAENRVEGIEVICRGNRLEIAAGLFIDTTGDAALVALANGAFETVAPGRLQRPAYIAMLRGLPRALLDDDGRLILAHTLKTGVQSGALPGESLGAGFRPGLADGTAYLTIDLAGPSDWDPTAPSHLTAIEQAGRKTALAIASFLADSLDGAAGCSVAAGPARAGIRESRRVTGLHRLAGDEILSGSTPEDGIAEVSWPMELRERATGPRFRFPADDDPATIPLRSLRHRDLANLWTAGRCISCDHEAQASVRVMGSCMATGEAAGIAAATISPAQPDPDWRQAASRVKETRTRLTRSC